ncbi:hypothetical protein MCOR33_004377 [Pyricularia grisea]|uniref:Thioester reductase (TE) domain-containing protein n=1 Tax=Pyricularia grisea TaxID=148305 RepID=A0ABQ8NNR2_PYRGI|nr:hypothetical protein MCOR33_004377 [Pyricularia grisea]
MVAPTISAARQVRRNPPAGPSGSPAPPAFLLRLQRPAEQLGLAVSIYRPTSIVRGVGTHANLAAVLHAADADSSSSAPDAVPCDLWKELLRFSAQAARQ